MAKHYTDPGPGDHPKLLYVFVEGRGPGSMDRLPPREAFDRARNLGLLMPSNWVRRAFVEQGIDQRRMRSLGLGVDPSIYAPSAHFRDLVRGQLKIDCFTAMNVSGMWGAKGVPHLLHAAVALLSEGRQLRLILKGNDTIYPSKQLLAEHIKQYPPDLRRLLSASISYIGREMSMLEMSALYNAADAYVSPYWAEGFNMPVLEAISCGLPVLCTAGGSTDDFTNREVARYIRSREVQADYGTALEPNLADVVDQLRAMMDDAAFRRRAYLAGPRHIAAGHTWDIQAARLVAIGKDWSAAVRANP